VTDTGTVTTHLQPVEIALRVVHSDLATTGSESHIWNGTRENQSKTQQHMLDKR
jgi:hypothetical protein